MTHPFIQCPGTAEVQMIYTCANERCENVYHVHNTAGWTTTSLNSLLTAMLGWENTSAKLSRSDNTILVELLARDLSSQNGAEAQASTNIVGTFAGTHLPNNATVAIKAVTGVAGRSFRGRTYWCGLTENHLDASGNSITNAQQTVLIGRMNDLITACATYGDGLCVLSRRTGGANRNTGLATPIINYALSDPYVDSQRRRLPGHNRHR